jgi:hypothetical protein
MAWWYGFGGVIKMAYICILVYPIGMFQINISNENGWWGFQDEDLEPKGNGAQDIHDNSLVITYLEVGEVLVGLTPKEWKLCCA